MFSRGRTTSRLFIHRKHQLPNSSAATRRRIQPPILRLKPKGSYNSLNYLAPTRWRPQPHEFSDSNHLVLRIQPKVSSNSLILWLQPKEGYNPISLHRPASLKYKCKPIVTDSNTVTATNFVTVIVTSNFPTYHYLIQEPRPTLIHMQLIPRSPISYLKPYFQHQQYMPLLSMHQDHQHTITR
jgi:hypothetical protein